jgi:hypothetical protein
MLWLDARIHGDADSIEPYFGTGLVTKVKEKTGRPVMPVSESMMLLMPIHSAITFMFIAARPA